MRGIVDSRDLPMNAQPRKPTNLSLDAALLTDAKELKLNDYRLTPVGSLFECNSRY
jgi:hypothetical protein